MYFVTNSSMILRARTTRWASVLALAILLVACGGGGGGSSSPPPSAVNRAPTFTSASTTSVEENVAGAFYQAVASDPDGDTVTYSIIGGVDAARFSITSGGQLSFVQSPNFDLPVDNDLDNLYLVQIGASDGRFSTTLALAVTVINSREGVAVRRIASGFTDPAAIAPISATAMLVAEKAGAVYLLNPQDGTRTLLLQITNVGDVGVTAIAPDTTFTSDGAFFVMYATANGLVLDRYRRNPVGSTVLFDRLLSLIAPQYAGGGWLGFDADSVLLAATGDAGGIGDPTGSAQDDTTFFGKIIRITPNPDPFAGAAPRYFILTRVAKGLHQPNGGSLFPGGILIADRGQEAAEEINFFPTGNGIPNYGWPFNEGTGTVRGNPPAGVLNPVIEYPRGSGFQAGMAIVGGALGPTAVASLRNQYVFADRNGAIFAVNASSIQPGGGTIAATTIERRDVDFTPDQGRIDDPVAIVGGPGGTLFILDAGGEIFRVDAQ